MNFTSNTQTVFKIRLCYITFLILSTIYCMVTLIIYNILLPIPILIANAMSLFNSLLHVCDMVHYNHPFPEDGVLLSLFDIMPNILIIYSIVCYIIYLLMGLIPIVQVEFVLMIGYAVVFGCGICLPFIGLILWYLGYCFSHLYEAL